MVLLQRVVTEDFRFPIVWGVGGGRTREGALCEEGMAWKNKGAAMKISAAGAPQMSPAVQEPRSSQGRHAAALRTRSRGSC